MFNFWNENSPHVCLMMYVSVVLLIVLIWHMCNKRNDASIDKRIMRAHYLAHIRKGDYPKLALSRHRGLHKKGMYGDCRTMLEKHKKTVEPEKLVMGEHSAGDSLHATVKKLDDPLSQDGLMQKSTETADQRLYRNLNDAGYDGPQLEGMSAPVIDFEESALSRQLVKQQEIYGEQDFDDGKIPLMDFDDSEADQLSKLNL